MRCRRRRFTSLLLAAGLFSFLSGCVVQRLIEFQRQLAAFDKNFQADFQHGLHIRALHPLLEIDDLHWLGLRPTLRTVTAEHESWIVRWIGEKSAADRALVPVAIDIGLEFTAGTLENVTLAQSYWNPAIQAFFSSVIRHVVSTNVNRLHRRITATIQASPDEMVSRTRLAEFEKVLGPATEIRNRNNTHQFSYHFISRSLHGVLNRAELTFSFTPDELLHEFRVKLPAGTVIFIFLPAPADARPLSSSQAPGTPR